ncbi:hypothetical protein [Nonomuraea sp. NPDC050691]|uniref:hypothetical protein n=1 Tax=Nonomuraea sp. NPDC050691 TaxID=3155661 RepID=UPI0033CFDBF9
MKPEPAPRTVLLARVVATVQAVAWFVGAGICLLAAAQGAGVAWAMAAVAAAWGWAIGRLANRVPRRVRGTRWLLIALEAAEAALFVTLGVVDGDFGDGSGLHLDHTGLSPNVLMAVAVIVLLLLPPARRWFDRPGDAVHLSASRTSDG